jgi:hypothetical protein
MARRSQTRVRLRLAAGIAGQKRQAELSRRARAQEDRPAVVLGGLEMRIGTKAPASPLTGKVPVVPSRQDTLIVAGTGTFVRTALPSAASSRRRWATSMR